MFAGLLGIPPKSVQTTRGQRAKLVVLHRKTHDYRWHDDRSVCPGICIFRTPLMVSSGACLSEVGMLGGRIYRLCVPDDKILCRRIVFPLGSARDPQRRPHCRSDRDGGTDSRPKASLEFRCRSGCPSDTSDPQPLIAGALMDLWRARTEVDPRTMLHTPSALHPIGRRCPGNNRPRHLRSRNRATRS